MAGEEIRKKWGTIFMGDREASVEQLNAMQEPLRKEKQQKGQAEDYMERVRARAADRAREILGAAYAERQKVLEEAKRDARTQKDEAASEAQRLKAEGETARQLAHDELAKAQAAREEAEQIRANAHEEGFQEGMEKAAKELREFRAELGNALSALLHAIERQRKAIIADWREQLVALTQCAAQAGSGFVLQREHEAILKALVYQALDLLENRVSVTLRVNPADENQVNDMFRAARERFPELRQWIVTGDPQVEAGGLIAESGSGSVDLRRENFRDMVDGVLAHLSLPESSAEAAAEKAVQEIIEKEVALIASLTPEEDIPVAPEPVQEEAVAPQEEPVEPEPAAEPPLQAEPEEAAPDMEEPLQPAEPEQMAAPEQDNVELRELEEELFPIDEEGQDPENVADPTALSEGGFV